MVAIVDCNSFYSSCERLFEPALNHKPVIVLSNNDGCIIARSDEAKHLGLPMAGPYYMVRDIIEKNQVAVFSSNYHLYGDVSRRVMETLKMMVGPEHVEVYSVDESFLDLAAYNSSQLNGLVIQIKQVVEQWTGIPVSIGVAPSKVLSKVANRLAKKDKQFYQGVMVLANEKEIDEALSQTAIRDIWGIGGRYAEKLQQQFNLQTALDLKNMNLEWARKNLGGVVGVRLLRELKGESCIEIKPPLVKKKMISCTRMFGRIVTCETELKEAVASYAGRAAEKLRRQHGAAKMLEVYLVKNDYEKIYKYNPSKKSLSIKLPEATSVTHQLINYALPLVSKLFKKGSRYLKAGVILSDLVPAQEVQRNVFINNSKPNQKLMDAMDNINWGMQKDKVRFGAMGLEQNWQMRQDYKSPRYTTRWNELKLVN